jgi:hypothetical protein
MAVSTPPFQPSPRSLRARLHHAGPLSVITAPSIWERFLEYELGHVRFVAELFEKTERRDAAEVLPERLPEPIRYVSHREYVREVLRRELTLSAAGTEFAPASRSPGRPGPIASI